MRVIAASCLALCGALGASAAEAAMIPLKRGIWASSMDGCRALAKAERKARMRIDNADVLDGVIEGTTAAFMIVESKSLGWPDAECAIGKAYGKGRFTQRPLTCLNSEGGKANDILRSITPAKIRFMGPYSATYVFCRR